MWTEREHVTVDLAGGRGGISPSIESKHCLFQNKSARSVLRCQLYSALPVQELDSSMSDGHFLIMDDRWNEEHLLYDTIISNEASAETIECATFILNKCKICRKYLTTGAGLDEGKPRQIKKEKRRNIYKF